MIEAGKLNRRLRLLAPHSQRNRVGEETVSFCDLATVWAARMNLSLGETNRMAGVVEQIECKFVIRWRSDVSTSNAVEHEGRTYDIVSVEEQGFREGLVLFVRAQS